MKIIGLTGGIATGKSEVVEVAREFSDILVIDGDKLAWSTYEKGKPAHNKIVDQFGQGILNTQGQIDRSALAGVVFEDKQKLLQLEAIVHPYLMEELQQLRTNVEDNYQILLVEGARLIQSDHVREDFFDFLVLVTADEPDQVKRLRHRDNLSTSEARRNISIQGFDNQTRQQADVILSTSCTLERTKEKARRLFQLLVQG